MRNLRIGDLVVRRSYGFDIVFRVIDRIRTYGRKKIVILKGINFRIIADAPETDLYRLPLSRIDDYNRSFNEKITKMIDKIMGERKKKNEKDVDDIKNLSDSLNTAMPFGKSGRVLHIDGDAEYLDICLKTYKQLEINVVGKQIAESEQPKVVLDLLREHAPDILVITGHDGILKEKEDYANIENYRNSMYFIEAVKEARKYESSMDDLVIFAGGCQSYYEGLLNAGANFASSPHRVLME
ncbi:sporulation peptidase YabG [Crassaminicella profunda]|uniref:sporulation peptidase YabG n=1 Tax=Crassaminicella profunda TaxID=1286698 RepID=UPI001CA5FC7A|nr:sporulation peptidase YabG [Crassaminicella profunda]QZY55443.1 sporulation peptidase YabG [Crassaminicella profunda]